MDELTALAVARQHDLGIRALSACLFARSECMLTLMMKQTITTYSSGEVSHCLASGRVTASQEPKDVGSIGDTLDSQVARADDGRQVVHHQGADITGSADVAALRRSPSVCGVLRQWLQMPRPWALDYFTRIEPDSKRSDRLVHTDQGYGTTWCPVGQLVGRACVGSGETYIGWGLGNGEQVRIGVELGDGDTCGREVAGWYGDRDRQTGRGDGGENGRGPHVCYGLVGRGRTRERSPSGVLVTATQ